MTEWGFDPGSPRSPSVTLTVTPHWKWLVLNSSKQLGLSESCKSRGSKTPCGSDPDEYSLNGPNSLERTGLSPSALSCTERNEGLKAGSSVVVAQQWPLWVIVS